SRPCRSRTCCRSDGSRCYTEAPPARPERPAAETRTPPPAPRRRRRAAGFGFGVWYENSSLDPSPWHLHPMARFRGWGDDPQRPGRFERASARTHCLPDRQVLDQFPLPLTNPQEKLSRIAQIFLGPGRTFRETPLRIRSDPHTERAAGGRPPACLLSLAG